jgi:hypothetical protein
MSKAKNSAKKKLLKKIIAGKSGKTGSPLASGMDLGKSALTPAGIGSGAGTNLGTNGIF